MMQLMTALAIAAFMLNFVLLSGHFELDGAECSDFHPESKQYFFDNRPWHQITRRQAAGGDEMPTTTTTNAAQDTEYCDFIRSNVYCSSGAAQNSVNNYLRCGYNVTYVRSRFDTCARSEGGTFCGSVEFISDMEQYLEGNCSEAVAINSSCSRSSLCHTHLENFKRKFGCCINAYLNGTYSFRRRFDYRLWNLCRIQLPSTDCENDGLIFNQPNAQMIQNCSDPYGNLDVVIFCSPNVIPLFINGLLNNTTADALS